MAGRLSKKELEQKKFMAEVMYMNFADQKVIAEDVGVSSQTISGWVNAGKWKEKRSAATITRPELVNKVLANINKMLNDAIENGDDTDFASLSDQLIKMTNTVEKLDKKNNVVNKMETFMAFNKWLVRRLTVDSKLTLADTKKINEYQNIFISESIHTHD